MRYSKFWKWRLLPEVRLAAKPRSNNFYLCGRSNAGLSGNNSCTEPAHTTNERVCCRLISIGTFRDLAIGYHLWGGRDQQNERGPECFGKRDGSCGISAWHYNIPCWVLCGCCYHWGGNRLMVRYIASGFVLVAVAVPVCYYQKYSCCPPFQSLDSYRLLSAIFPTTIKTNKEPLRKDFWA